MSNTLSQNVVTLLAEKGLTRSHAEGRRLVRAGAVTVDGFVVTDVAHVVDRSRSREVTVGRRDSRRLRLSPLAFTESSSYSY